MADRGSIHHGPTTPRPTHGAAWPFRSRSTRSTTAPTPSHSHPVTRRPSLPTSRSSSSPAPPSHRPDPLHPQAPADRVGVTNCVGCDGVLYRCVTNVLLFQAKRGGVVSLACRQ